MKKSTIIGIAFVVAAICFYIFSYWNKGGFNTTEIKVVSKCEVELVGMEYNGVVNTPKFGKYFDEVEHSMKAKHVGGHVGAYFYNSPGVENNLPVKAFVGAFLEGEAILLRDSFEIRKVKLPRCLHGEQEANLMVASIYDDLREYAAENNLRLDSNVVLEQYVGEKMMVVDIPILE